MRGRRGPGLIGTAVVVGGAAHMGAKSAQKSQAAAQQQAAPPPPEQAAPAAPVELDPTAEIQKYGALKDQGLLTEEEFAAKKKEILGL
jgi:Short C-terminal domain